jgi:hypothetical protein
MIKNNMPIMRPVPIDTQGQKIFTRIKRWITVTRQWEIMENWDFTLPNGVKITIPSGFVFDGASVPRPFRVFLSPTGILFIPSVLHDFGYRYGFLWATTNSGHRYQFGTFFGQVDFDSLFYDVAKMINGMPWVDSLAWGALRAFGWKAWNKNKKTRAST